MMKLRRCTKKEMSMRKVSRVNYTTLYSKDKHGNIVTEGMYRAADEISTLIVQLPLLDNELLMHLEISINGNLKVKFRKKKFDGWNFGNDILYDPVEEMRLEAIAGTGEIRRPWK